MLNKVSLKQVTTIIAGLAGIYFLIVNSRVLSAGGVFIPLQQHRAIALLFALVLAYLAPRKKHGGAALKPKWYDVIFLAAGLISAGYIVFSYDSVSEYVAMGFVDSKGIILAFSLAVSLLVAVRKTTGLTLPAVVLFFGLLPLFQQYLPGALEGRAFSIDRLAQSIYIQHSGIFGIPLGVAATILIIFIIFGRMLQEIGGGDWLTNLALSVTGQTTGGPAKAAILSSTFFATISGSPGANVATTGSVTIPLMKRTGFSKDFAGAVEAVASTGGQIMPPVMGAIAFLMAEWLQIPYVQVVKAAVIPGLLFYIALFISVHLHTKRLNIGSVSTPTERPGQIVKRGWYFLVPIGVLIICLLVLDYPPDMSGIISIVSIVAVSYLGPPERRLGLRKIWKCLVESSISWVPIGVITATIGIMIGSLQLSGIAIKATQFILDISGGELLVTLFLVGITSLILGMGLDSIPIYLTLTILTAPVLSDLGVPLIVSHLFVIYFGLASFITPPVCAAVYIACGISEGNFWRTGWQACRLGIACFIVPFVFVYRPELLMQGSWLSVIYTVAIVAVGLAFVASALEGYLIGNLNLLERALFIFGGIILLIPGLWALFTGAVIVISTLSAHFLRQRKQVKQEKRQISGV